MRILLTVHQFFPEFTLGTERYTLSLAKGLAAMGDDVTVLTVDLEQSADSEGNAVREYEWDGVRVLAINAATSPIRRLSDYHTRPDRKDLYSDILDNFRPDIVHCCHLLHLGVDFLTACNEMDVPVTATLTDLWGICWAGQMVRPCDNQLCDGPKSGGANCAVDFLEVKKSGNRFSSKTERCIASLPGRSLQTSVVTAASVLPKKLQRKLLPDVTDIRGRNAVMAKAFATYREVWFPSRFLQESCEEFGLIKPGLGSILTYGIRTPNDDERQQLQSLPEKDGPVFAFIGQMARHKGLDLLLDAFKNAAIPNATLVIHGKPNPGDPHAAAILEQIDQTPGVEYKGSFNGDSIYSVLRDVDAVVVPSIWHENAPLVMLEALSAGRPVLTSKARGMVDFVDDGKTGLIFDMNSTSAIEQALTRFADNQREIQNYCLVNPGYQFTPADHAKALRTGLERHARTSEWVPRISPAIPLVKFLKSRTVATPEYSPSVDQIAVIASQAGLRGCEVRLPSSPCTSPDAWAAAYAPSSNGSSPRPAANGHTNPLGATFPRLDKDHLLLRSHNKPYASLWGKGHRSMQLLKLPDIHSADTLRICCRPKNGMSSRLKVSGTKSNEKESHNVEMVHTWNWTSKQWTNLEIDLAALRNEFDTITRIEWTPMTEKSPWKLDIAQLSLT